MPPSITSIKNLRGKKVLVRVDFNTPVIRGRLASTYRIDETLPTILYLRKQGAKIILVSHADGNISLAPIANYLEKKLPGFSFKKVPVSKGREVIEKLPLGGSVLFENLFFEEGERKNDFWFSQLLASFADIYVNEAFSTSHREYASLVGAPLLLPRYVGFLFEKEIRELKRLSKPKKPLLLIVGGAKISTKLPLIKTFEKKAEIIFVGGALANDAFKEMGLEIGTSIYDKSVDLEKKMLRVVSLPLDVITEDGRVVMPNDVGQKEKIVDAGPATVAFLIEKMEKAKSILINGPLGAYEDGFGGATETLLKAAIKTKARVVVGGGDTVTLVEKIGLLKKFSFVSTGGGAMLEYLATGKLPGLTALLKKKGSRG